MGLSRVYFFHGLIQFPSQGVPDPESGPRGAWRSRIEHSVRGSPLPPYIDESVLLKKHATILKTICLEAHPKQNLPPAPPPCCCWVQAEGHLRYAKCFVTYPKPKILPYDSHHCQVFWHKNPISGEWIYDSSGVQGWSRAVGGSSRAVVEPRGTAKKK